MLFIKPQHPAAADQHIDRHDQRLTCLRAETYRHFVAEDAAGQKGLPNLMDRAGGYSGIAGCAAERICGVIF